MIVLNVVIVFLVVLKVVEVTFDVEVSKVVAVLKVVIVLNVVMVLFVVLKVVAVTFEVEVTKVVAVDNVVL